MSKSTPLLAAPPPTFGGDAATRNAIRNGEHARLMEEGDRSAPESDAELRSKLREFRLVQVHIAQAMRAHTQHRPKAEMRQWLYGLRIALNG